jgi:hypothetical protein
VGWQAARLVLLVAVALAVVHLNFLHRVSLVDAGGGS